MNNRTKLLYVKLIILIMCLVIILRLFTLILAKYESETSANTEIDIAFYLFKEDYQTMTLNLGTIKPQNNVYAFDFTIGENGAPLINAAKISIECEMDHNYELEGFDNFIGKILATYADESILNEAGKIDYHVFKPVLFEFPTYEYFVTGDKVGDCAKMNK